MIIANGVATGVGDDGRPFTHYVFEEIFQQLLETSTAQAQLPHQNDATRTQYMYALNEAQQAVEKGEKPAAPPKPLMRKISDSGTVSDVPFDPPLPDLVYQAPAGPGLTAQIAAIRAANPDPIQQILMGLAKVSADVAAIRKKVGA